MATDVTSAITPAELTERSRRTLAQAEEIAGRIERDGGSDRTTVLDPYDQAWLLANTVGLEAGLLKEVHPDRAVRSAAEDLSLEVTRFFTRLQHSRQLYDALARAAPADDGERRLIQVVRDEMRHAGVELDDGGRKRVLTMREELTRLSQDLQRDHRDDVRAVELRPEQLAGMPDDYVKDHPAGPNGKVRITTDYPDYLEYRTVRQAILDLNSELFGLEFSRSSEPPWHPSVETFEVAVDGKHSGRISLDMHPRPGKFKHAANFGYRPGAAGRQETHSVLVCNFPDPNTVQGPALMDHKEVVTYFHEFGHLVHSIMRGRLRWARLARPVEFDFIEAPSQFLEQWIFDHGVLRRFARHVETGEPISEQMVAKLREARDFGRGVQTQRAVFMSMVSLELHDRDPKDLDVMKVWHELAEKWSPTEMDPEGRFPASWTHMPGYAASYYTYTLSRAVAEDLSTGFTNGLMDLGQSRRYRDIVLAQGGMKPALTMVGEFLGRPHDLTAFRRWLE